MARLRWNDQTAKLYESGLDRGVLYPTHQEGYAWNGLLGVEEGSTGGDAEPLYFDGVKVYNRVTPDEFSGTISAYTYPDEFEPALGLGSIIGPSSGLYIDNQLRKEFSLSYRTGQGNGIQGTTYGYKIHIIYNATVTDRPITRATMSDEPSPGAFSWSIETRPIFVEGHRASAHLIIDSTRTHPQLMQTIESYIWGSDDTSARLPTPLDLIGWYNEFQPAGYGWNPYGEVSYGN